MKVITIILGVLTTLLGIFCVFRPGVAALSLAWLLGIILILAGFNIVNKLFREKNRLRLGCVLWNSFHRRRDYLDL
ncbi:MAG: DUF308 domain-containing protein [Clostridiales Family XIII bacterium]|nr:DUF308 domain-containing protein [Clostridia bacterium]MDY3011796.1 DUF308 domain-containing protein [Clostridiales Family XIII bacterium]